MRKFTEEEKTKFGKSILPAFVTIFLVVILIVVMVKVNQSCDICQIQGTPVAIMYTKECPECGGEVNGDYTLVTPKLTSKGMEVGYEYCIEEGCGYNSPVFKK